MMTERTDGSSQVVNDAAGHRLGRAARSGFLAVALAVGALLWGAVPAGAMTYGAALLALEEARGTNARGEAETARTQFSELLGEVAETPDIPDALRADVLSSVHAELAGIAWRAGDGGTAARHLEDSLATYGEARLRERPASFILHKLTLAAALAYAGEMTAADAAYRAAEEHFKVLFADNVNNQLAFSIVFKREMTRSYLDLLGHRGGQAVENAAGATQRAESLGTPYASVHKLTQAFALASDDRLREAAEAADGAAAGGLPFGRDYVSRALMFRAGALGALGERAEAVKLARAAEGYAETNDAQVAVLQLLTGLDGGAPDAPWPARYDPRSDEFFLTMVPRMRLTSQIKERGDKRLPEPIVNVGYAFDFVDAE